MSKYYWFLLENNNSKGPSFLHISLNSEIDSLTGKKEDVIRKAVNDACTFKYTTKMVSSIGNGYKIINKKIIANSPLANEHYKMAGKVLVTVIGIFGTVENKEAYLVSDSQGNLNIMNQKELMSLVKRGVFITNMSLAKGYPMTLDKMDIPYINIKGKSLFWEETDIKSVIEKDKNIQLTEVPQNIIALLRDSKFKELIQSGNSKKVVEHISNKVKEHKFVIHNNHRGVFNLIKKYCLEILKMKPNELKKCVG